MRNILTTKAAKTILLVLHLICTSIAISAKAPSASPAARSEYQSVDALYLNELRANASYKVPSLLGMDADSLSTYIAHSLRYPYELIGDTISSRCSIKFDVDSTGCVTNIRSLRLSRNIPELADEVQDVVKTLKFSGCPQRYDSIAGNWRPDTLGLTIMFSIVPYPVECISKKEIIIEELTKINSYQIFGSNGWGGTPLGWSLQQRLKAVTSAQEKKDLFLTQANPVVRLTAFDGLLESNDPDCVAFVKSSITDSSSVMCWSCDVGFQESLSDALISKLFSNKDAFTKADSLGIDSLVLYSSTMYAYDYKGMMLHRMKPLPERYARVKDLCQNKHECAALYLLAKYKLEEDKLLFIEALSEYKMGLDKDGARNGKYSGRADDALEAIISWPDKAFIPVLEKLGDYELTRKYHDTQRIENFYRVIMEYDNDWAYEYLEDYFGKKKAGKVYSHPENLYRAYYLNKHPHERFLPLIKKYAEEPWDWKYNKEK